MSKARQLADLGNVYDDGALSNRNLIINGAMQVAQRGTLSSVALNTNTYTSCDRFQLSGDASGTAVVTTSQDSDAPNGFGSSLKIDVTTADASLASTDGVRLLTRLEGQDLQHIKKGTADAQQVTLSFWVKSPKTGTHIAELFDVDTSGSRTVGAEYTITSANTWQNVSLTFPADTTGAFDNDNQQSLLIVWWLAAGSNYTSGTLQTDWAARTDANRAVGQVNCLDDTANNFYLTGIQLEVGDTATPFEHRSYGDELARCQRYYFKLRNEGVYTRFAIGENISNASNQAYIDFPVTMRTIPTLETSGSASDYAYYHSSVITGCTSISLDTFATSSVAVISTGCSGTPLLDGGASQLMSNFNTVAYLAFDAEL